MTSGITERPILFKDHMIQAIRSGRKTQTRRLATNENIARVQVGDRLWVREAYGFADGGIIYRVDQEFGRHPKGHKWRPGIFMSRRYARTLLRVTEVRTQALQDITNPDAMAEGVPDEPNHWLPVARFMALWDEINPNRPWRENPEVIALTFELED